MSRSARGQGAAARLDVRPGPGPPGPVRGSARRHAARPTRMGGGQGTGAPPPTAVTGGGGCAPRRRRRRRPRRGGGDGAGERRQLRLDRCALAKGAAAESAPSTAAGPQGGRAGGRRRRGGAGAPGREGGGGGAALPASGSGDQGEACRASARRRCARRPMMEPRREALPVAEGSLGGSGALPRRERCESRCPPDPGRRTRMVWPGLRLASSLDHSSEPGYWQSQAAHSGQRPGWPAGQGPSLSE